MARSEEAEAFFHVVYTAIQQIPYGKVTTYGHIAKLIGTRTICLVIPSIYIDSLITKLVAERPRQVGICLKHLPQDADSRFNHDNVPWQRVINAKGMISPRCAISFSKTIHSVDNHTDHNPRGHETRQLLYEPRALPLLLARWANLWWTSPNVDGSQTNYLQKRRTTTND